MRIVHLVPGTGDFHCGACLRDHALLTELRTGRGHEVLVVPLYLPLVLDAPEPGETTAPVFLGGVNLFLQQKTGFFRRTPRWLDRSLDAGGVLRLAARFSGMTRASDLGEMTLSSFEAGDGRQAKEWRRLFDWLAARGRPDVISLSNGLLAGAAGMARRELGVPVVASLQGEDAFLDALPESHRERCWSAFRECCRDVSKLVAVSRDYGERMSGRLGFGSGKLRVVPNGIDPGVYAPVRGLAGKGTIGFFGRMCHGKGLHTVVRAFLILRERGGSPDLKLKIGGARTAADAKYVRGLRREIARAGAETQVSWHENLSRDEKLAFLRSLTVFSMPANYGEAFGLPVIEAMACEVPVVQPRRGAFQEIVEKSGGGILYNGGADEPEALADAVERLLRDESLREELGRRGREGVAREYSIGRMAEAYEKVLEEAVGAGNNEPLPMESEV